MEKYQIKRHQKQNKQTLIQQSLHKKKAERIIEQCILQNKDFKQMKSNRNWSLIHSSHYDWWAFPINQRSSYGDKYMLEKQQIQIMKNSQQFMIALSENSIIVCEAWGYNLQKRQLIKNVDQYQKWHNWPIRLYKMTKSLQLFGIINLFQSAVNYGMLLIKQSKKFTYGQRDLGSYFNMKSIQIKNKNSVTKNQKSSLNTKSQQKIQKLQKQNKFQQKQQCTCFLV